VFDTFINYINQTLENDNIHSVYIDATHLNKRSRDKVLRRVREDNIAELNCVCFDVPLETCYARNNLREGRSHVPQTAIANMYQSYRIPDKATENFNHIIIVDEDGNETEV
jgi:predicted kinase